jgi:hypothetical protein
MADVGIYATNAQIQARAGLGANATSKAVAWTDTIILDCENVINVLCRKVFAVDAAAFTALSVSTKYILSDAAASLAAILVIQYSFAGYPSRIVAEDMINILRDAFLRDVSLLRDKKTQDFLMDPTAGGG